MQGASLANLKPCLAMWKLRCRQDGCYRIVDFLDAHAEATPLPVDLHDILPITALDAVKHKRETR